MSCLGPPPSHSQVILFLLLNSAAFLHGRCPSCFTYIRYLWHSVKQKVLFSSACVSHRAALTGLPVTDQLLTSVCFLAQCSAAAHALSTLANSSASHGVFGFPLNTEISFLAQEVSAPRATGSWETGPGELSLCACSVRLLLSRHLLLDSRTAGPCF